MIQGGEKSSLDLRLQIELPVGGAYESQWEQVSVYPVGRHVTIFWFEPM
jgi:hypothetical protein